MPRINLRERENCRTERTVDPRASANPITDSGVNIDPN